MLNPIFVDSLLTIFLCVVCSNCWYLYSLTTNIITPPVLSSTDINKHKLIKINQSLRVTIVGAFILCAVLLSIVFILRNNTRAFLYDTLYFSNNTTTYLFIVITILGVIILMGLGLANQTHPFSHEYIIFVILIITGSYLLISSLTIFLTIFLLELIALLIFGKMVVSRTLVKINKVAPTKSFNKNQYSFGLFNSLFFQFWANFVSSIFLFVSLINIHYVFGTSNFFVTNFLLSLMSSNWYITGVFLSVVTIVLLTGFFIKLGLAPYQFFKIEIYKGIPLYIVIVYTSIYLITYIYFFVFLFIYQLTALREFTGAYTLFVLLISLIYVVSLLFDTKNFKAFLAYSTLITISNIFIILLVV